MSSLLKCPNPSCPYTFDPARVPAGVVLSCPRCTMQFTLGAPAAAPPAPSQPAFEPEFEEVGRSAADRDSDEPRPGRRTGRYQVFILVGIAAVLMAGTALAVIFKLVYRGKGGASGDYALVDNDRNVALEAVPKGWTQDDSVRARLGPPYLYGFKRESPEAYIAFGAVEYAKNRSPRPTEMKRGLDMPLGKVFTNLDRELSSESAWLGLNIGSDHGFKFRAKGDGLTWQGEAYTVASKGVAYFWTGWAGESDYDGLKGEFAAFRAKFKLLDTREQWREIVVREVEYKGAVAPYTITDSEDIWKDTKPDDDEREKAPDLDRWFRINHAPRHDRKALTDDADLRIYLVDPGAGDPLKQAREYVEVLWAKHIVDSNLPLPPPKFTELTGEPQGDPLPKGTTPVVRLESRVVDPANPRKVLASTESRLLVVSAIKVAYRKDGKDLEKVVVLHCWCELDKREEFETRFIQIASSLR